MVKYELTIVTAGGASPAKKKQITKSVESLVKSEGGKIAKTDDWGEKDLSFEIKKSSTGYFVHYELELEPQTAGELEQRLKLTDEVIRHLLIRV